MTYRLLSFFACGWLLVAMGCQNPLGRTAKFGERDTFDARLSVSSDDPASLESGRGHLPSLASEMSDHRREANRSSGIPGGSSLTIARMLERGHDADSHGRTQEARMYYEQVLSEQPGHPEAHHRLAILADRANDFEDAERHYHLALEGRPNDPDVLNDLGYSCFLQGRAADAERYLTQALDRDPKHPHVQENLSLLSDRAKAEKVLLSVMGPRQTQVTLARLYDSSTRPSRQSPARNSFDQFADRRQQDRSRNESNPHTQSTPELSQELQDLQRKMEDARMQSIAKRQNRNVPQQPIGRSYPPAGRPQAGPPQWMENTPPPLPSQYGMVPTPDVRVAHLNDVFRSIDQGGHTPRGAQQPPQPQYTARQLPQVPSANFQNAPPMMTQQQPVEARAAAPQWNQPPRDWPQDVPPLPSAQQQGVRQTNYTQAAPQSAPSLNRTPAELAAEIGMAAGPGAIFPPLENESNQLPQGPMSARRSMPGSQSRMHGGLYQSPHEYRHTPTSEDNQWTQQRFDTGAQWNTPPANGQPPVSNHRQAAASSYDQMRARHDDQYYQDQQQLPGNPHLMTNGHPARNPVPGTFNPNNQQWPAYTREQYDTRNNLDAPQRPQVGNPHQSNQW